MIEVSTLPGEGLSVLGRNRCVTSSKRCRDVSVMVGESADEAVVVVKLDACDGMVTYLRVKHSVSDQSVWLKAKGGTCDRCSTVAFGTVIMSSVTMG
jgi:ferredoxin-fold anticodon binding domain-containing protein